MSFDIAFDFRFESSGFFDVPERLAALEAAAAIWEGLLLDEFDDVPAEIAFSVENPSNRTLTEPITLAAPIDDLLIFVGTDDLGGSLGLAGPDGFDAQGDAFSSRVSGNFRGTGPVTDFEPWAGTITFDPDIDWNFDIAGPVPGKSDFISTATHEIGHILGVGTAPIFDQIGFGAAFDGPNALAVNGGNPIPLTPDLGHVVDGFAGGTVLMDPTSTVGARKTPTQVDLALLADIGFEITGFTKQGSTPPIATEGDDGTIFGTILGDVIDALGGSDQIVGNSGADTLLGGAGSDVLFGQIGDDTLDGGGDGDQVIGGDGADTLRGGSGTDTLFGDAGSDVFEIHGGDGANTIADFELVGEVIRLVNSGLADAAAAVAAITKPFSNVSRVTLADGTTVDVFHASQSGTPLNQTHFDVVGTQAAAQFSVAATDADRAEGDAGSTAFTFTVTRAVDTSGAASVDFAVTGSGPTPATASDFAGGVLPSGTVSFADDESAKPVTVQVAGDGAVEPDEGFTLTLSNPSAGTEIAVASAPGTIRNDDGGSPQPEPAIGIIRGTDRDDGLLVVQGVTYLGGDGDDFYVLSQAVAPLQTSVINDNDADEIELVDGLEIASSTVTANAIQLTLVNGAVVQILNAASYSYDVGGNATTGTVGQVLDFASFAQSVLGVAVPASGFATGGPVTVGPGTTGFAADGLVFADLATEADGPRMLAEPPARPQAPLLPPPPELAEHDHPHEQQLVAEAGLDVGF